MTHRKFIPIALIAVLLGAIYTGAAIATEEKTVKEGAKEVGHTVGTAVREVGHETRKVTKKVGKTVKEATKTTGHAFRDGAKEFKKTVNGEGESSTEKQDSGGPRK